MKTFVQVLFTLALLNGCAGSRLKEVENQLTAQQAEIAALKQENEALVARAKNAPASDSGARRVLPAPAPGPTAALMAFLTGHQSGIPDNVMMLNNPIPGCGELYTLEIRNVSSYFYGLIVNSKPVIIFTGDPRVPTIERLPPEAVGYICRQPRPMQQVAGIGYSKRSGVWHKSNTFDHHFELGDATDGWRHIAEIDNMTKRFDRLNFLR